MSFGEMIVLVSLLWHGGISISQARDAYFRSADSKKNALDFEQLLNSVKEDAAPVLVCYKGAAEMLKAKNTINPFGKFACFKRGKNLIERSLARDSANLEAHFIRYTIQRNLPWFLDYNKNIHADSVMIAKRLNDIKDQDLKNKITGYFNYLKASANKK